MSGPDAMRELTCDEVREMAGAYVLGALDAADEAAVRAHLATCSQAHEEIAELGAVIPAFVEIVPVVEPPEGLKARILAAAAADLAARGGTPAAAPGSAEAAPATAASRPTIAPAAPIAFPSAEERAARQARTSTGGWLLRIAAVLVIAVLGGWNLLLQSQLSAAQSDERNVAAVLNAAAQPSSLSAILTADGGTGSGLAAVKADGDVAIAMRDLAPTSGNAVYEAWVIGGDGVPVPLGSFQVGTSGTAYFESAGLPTADGIVLALTLEPGPGATTPTLPIISKGVAT
ncbi:MAG: anti-sigma factor, partial [Candidatus Limnocylindrales bacterium]|nr:anti-sigma factor [Candidatus Limnocylindrales bacterium]